MSRLSIRRAFNIAFVLFFVAVPTCVLARTGTAVWRSGSLSSPRYSEWSGSWFSAPDSTAPVGDYRIVAAAASPTRNEINVIGVTEDSEIAHLMYDGDSWQDSFGTMATVSESFWWGFAVGYEQVSGDAMIIWNNGKTDTSGISYRIWNGADWTGETELVTPLAGEPQQMRLACNPLSDEMVLVVSNSNSYDYVFVWDGTDWVDTLVLSEIDGDDRTDIYAAYEQQSGNAMVVYGVSDVGPRYRIWNGSGWSDEAEVLKPGSGIGNVRWTVLGTRPNSNHIILGIVTFSGRAWLSVWDGAAWAPSLQTSTTINSTVCPALAVAFESVSGDALVVYSDDDPFKYRRWNESTNWTNELAGPDVGGSPNTILLQSSYDSDNIMLTIQDDNEDFNCVLWNDSMWGTPIELETETTEIKNQPFAFVWDLYSVNDPPILDPIGPQTVTEGENLNFEVTSSDPDSTIPILIAEDIPANSSFTDHGDGTASFDFNPSYTQAGVYPVRFIASDGALADSEIVEITVNADPVSYIVVEPDSVVLSADSSQLFSVTGFDGGDNEIDPGNITWQLTAPVGTIDGSGDFDAATVGIARVVAISDLGPTDTSAYLEVTPGVLATLQISPNRDTISADSTRLFMVSGGDSDGNPVVDLGSISWSVLGSIGTIDQSGLFTAGTAGAGFIRVTSDIGPTSLTDTITVVAGTTAYISVVPHTNVMIEDSSYQFTAYSYDADSNLVDDETTDATWSTTDPSGSVSAGLYTAGTDLSPPDYHVKAVLGAFADSSTVTVISSGALSYIRVETPDGNVYPDTTLTTDESTELVCRAYDSGNNLIGDVVALWSLLSAEPIGTVESGPNTSSELTLKKPGTGRVVAVHEEHEDTSGVITCIPGAPNYCVIFPDSATISADSTLQFSCEFYDADSNLTAPPTPLSWSVLGGIGTISSDGLFTAVQAGTGNIVCTGAGVTDTTGVIAVVSGDLYTIEVSPDSIQLAVGDTALFTAIGTDVDGNPADVGTLEWSVAGDIGVMDTTGVFTATTSGTGRIAVISSIGSITDTNTAVVVQPSSLNMLVVTPDTASLMVTGSKTFSVLGFDDAYQPAYVGNITWEVIGGIGFIDSDGNFTATSRGSGRIVATSSIEGVSDTTRLIAVEVPTVSDIPIGNVLTRPGDDQSPLVAFRLSNAFDSPNQLEGITARLANRGAGSSAQLLSNTDTLSLYIDANGNNELDAADTRIADQSVHSNVVNFTFPAYTLAPSSENTFFVSMHTYQFAHDSDSVDAFLRPALDIRMVGGITTAGPDSINSLGYCLIDGMVSDQLTLTSTGLESVVPTPDPVHILTLDIPRNGYAADILQILSVINPGTADRDDIDSLILYRDNGNGIWDGDQSEPAVGGMKFTGGLWTISGMSETLLDLENRFFVAASLTGNPTNGAMMSFGVPVHGIEVASGNDGPIDTGLDPVDSIVILSTETLAANVFELQSRTLIPGQSSGPILAVELTNTMSESASVSRVTVHSTSDDPGGGATQEELDSQIESVSLWLDNDWDLSSIGPSDIKLGETDVINGVADFSFDSIAIGSGADAVNLLVEAALDDTFAKNGNSIGFSIAEASDIEIAEGYEVSGAFPLYNAGSFTVDAFQASRITVSSIAGTTLLGGDEDQPVLDLIIPGDGYDAAVLSSIKIENASSSGVAHALSNVKLWMDVANDGFDLDDDLLAQLFATGNGWQNNSISAQIPQAGARLIVTVSVSPSTAQGGTLLPQVPTGGIGFASGTTGPDDHAVANPESFVILPSDQVTVVSVPIESDTLKPGSEMNTLLKFALYNGYPDQAQTLNSIRLSNFSHTASTQSFADSEIGQVSIYFDTDSNRILDDDLMVAAGYFSNGTVNLTGLEVELAPQSINHFFVVSDLPLYVIDSDTLLVGVQISSDFVFEGTVNINGDLPLLPGGSLIIDGSVSAQYGFIPLTEYSVYPGQDSVVLFSFVPAVNGDQQDLLNQLTLVNLGSAQAGSISELRLWADGNGDSVWQPTDQYAGQFTEIGQNWTADNLEIEISDGSPILFAEGDVSIDSETGTTLRFSLPIDGCQYASGNDGPLDASLHSARFITISDAGLHLTYAPFERTYSIGQQIAIDITVLNRFTYDIDSIFCSVAGIEGAELLNLTDSMLGPVTIASGEESEFYLKYEAVGAGIVSWQLQAYSASTPDSSIIVLTESVRIQELPPYADVDFVSSIPTSVTRGQSHIFPMSLICSHFDYDDNSAPLKLDSMTLDVEDATGNPLAAGGVFSRVVLSSGYTVLGASENLPSESSITLHFSQPLIIQPGNLRQISLRTDIDSLTDADEFAIVVKSGNSLPFVDANSSVPVDINPDVEFPFRTAVCRIDDPSQHMLAFSIPRLNESVNYGQQDVALIDLVMSHPGDQGSSQIQLSGINISALDGSSNSIHAAEIFSNIRLQRGYMILGQTSAFDPEKETFKIPLSSPPVFSPGEIETLTVVGSLVESTSVTEFEVTILDSTWFEVRDLSSGSVIPVVGETDSILAEYVFPMTSGLSQMMQPSIPPEVCLEFTLNESVVAGADSLSLLRIGAEYPAPVDHASITLNTALLIALDSLGRPLDPYMLFDRIGYRDQSDVIAYQQFFDLHSGYIVFDLSDAGISLDPGETVELELVADLRIDVPYDHFTVVFPGDEGISITDVNDLLFDPGFDISDQCNTEMPMTSGVATVYVPAGRPDISGTSDRVQMGFRGQQDLEIPLLNLSYGSGSRQGELDLISVNLELLKRTPGLLMPVDAAGQFERVQLEIDGNVVAADSVFDDSRVYLEIESGYRLLSGDHPTLTLKCSVKDDAETGNYKFAIEDSAALSLHDENLSVSVFPSLEGGSYPIYSTELSIAEQGLGASLSNYPNPFNPSQNMETRITFVLSEAATVDIEIFSVTGESVKLIADHASREAGDSDEDIWSGRNDNGSEVAPGTYFCRVTARYGSGRVEEALRKIAVIR